MQATAGEEHPNYANVNLSWGSSRKLSEAGGEKFAIFNAAWCESISAIQGMLPSRRVQEGRINQ
jgi:hypothetical protein